MKSVKVSLSLVNVEKPSSRRIEFTVDSADPVAIDKRVEEFKSKNPGFHLAGYGYQPIQNEE